MLILKRNYIDDLFEDMVGDFFERQEPADKLRLSLPGVGKDNIEIISSKKEEITIKWKVKDGKETRVNKKTYSVIPFKEAEAEYVDGILEVRLVPEEKNEPIKIKVA